MDVEVLTNDPIKIAVGLISILDSLVMSKSVRVIPILHMSGSPQKGATSIDLLITTTWGRVLKLVPELNLLPSNCSSVARPILTKSWGPKENGPISDKSTFITIVWLPTGTP